MPTFIDSIQNFLEKLVSSVNEFFSTRGGEELVLFSRTPRRKMTGVRIFLHLIFIVSLVLVHSNNFAQDSTFECPKCKELVETGIGYNGNDIRSISNVKSWSRCKEGCTEEPACKFWTYLHSTSKCFLKTSDKGRRTEIESARTSGTRGCKAENKISATADFSQNNLCGFKAPGLRGHRLKYGDFIFSWRNKMVLTDNQGHVKKWGIVEYG